MISQFVGLVTRREGRKFLKLNPEFDESVTAEEAGDEEVSLYIHIPFCKTLCPFCCFNRYLFKEARTRRYFRHLRSELDLYIQRGFKFSDFYFGGGTPTILMDELTDFIAYLKKHFVVKRMSLETTPREVSRQNIAMLKAAGINRLSIGVQSFDNDTLKAMGRPFVTGEEAKEKLSMAQGEFDTLNVDFVFNFPSQTLTKFEADVRTFKELGIDQATFYPLMASPHKKSSLERKFNRVDTFREKVFYGILLRELYAGGYKASTAWCFSRGERMIDEYIIDFDDYIGIGAGSVSVYQGNFLVNSFSLDRYEEFTGRDRLPVVGWRRLSAREHRRYYLLTKLFGLEVAGEKFYRRFNAGIHEKLRDELLFLKLSGLVKEAETIRVTPRGMYPVSVMMREFFTALNGLREFYIERQI
ncbi:MAG: coproporphyrinogen III oxidase family protein [Dehalococcoidales bacterium]|jgi:coproporphyrinogen III oxidase-like Fe-S oxidoreductase|nr:coproporphyrinogen III oxidase family protein [Dehalococcoidales bacterium]MDP6577405.1 coproporphyrinogen III oxidase family protein [Dehalococcoidales bacterium]MDP6824947.1 coproporphyrinogen III oxidase family protein [Dehalococcoidales bacterium]|tara:strand:- start:833 stop:2074 length:1242 start_codon:yes stop_codon:yes gene_type:complete